MICKECSAPDKIWIVGDDGFLHDAYPSLSGKLSIIPRGKEGKIEVHYKDCPVLLAHIPDEPDEKQRCLVEIRAEVAKRRIN